MVNLACWRKWKIHVALWWNNFENIFEDVPLKTLNISVARTSKFWMCIKTDLSCLSNSAKPERLSLFIIRKYFSWILYILRIHRRLLTYLKTSYKSVWSNVFWYVKVYIFWKLIQYTIHYDKIQILKKFPSDKVNTTKNALFFISRVPTHHSFTFNSQFLYQLKHMVHISKIVSGIFHFQFRLVFIKLYIFVQ